MIIDIFDNVEEYIINVFICIGFYVFKEFVFIEYVVVERNEDYWGGKVGFVKVIFKCIND